MGLALATIRTRVAAAITAAGFRESRWNESLFGMDPSHVAHKTFAIGIPTSTATPRARGRLAVSTTVTVTWSARIRADNQRLDYGAALTLEVDIIGAVMGASKVNLFSLDYVTTSQREIVPTGDWFLGRLVFEAKHFLEV